VTRALSLACRGCTRCRGQPVLLDGASVGRWRDRPGRHAHGPRPRPDGRAERRHPGDSLRSISDVSAALCPQGGPTGGRAAAPLESVLVANRGEIAVRIFRTCARLGVRAIAVYSDADARSAHVALADQALRIGPPPASESYLKTRAILKA